MCRAGDAVFEMLSRRGAATVAEGLALHRVDHPLVGVIVTKPLSVASIRVGVVPGGFEPLFDGRCYRATCGVAQTGKHCPAPAASLCIGPVGPLKTRSDGPPTDT